MSADLEQKSYQRCVVCQHPDRGWIEHLLASGAALEDVSGEFSVKEFVLKRHDQFHSTVQPNIDPVSIVREIRYLMHDSQRLSHKIRRTTGNAIKVDKWKLEMDAVQLRLRVLQSFAQVINVKKHIDQNVTLPRWANVMAKIAKAFKDDPAATRKLYQIFKDEGPVGSATYGVQKPPTKADRAVNEILAAEVPMNGAADDPDFQSDGRAPTEDSEPTAMPESSADQPEDEVHSGG